MRDLSRRIRIRRRWNGNDFLELRLLERHNFEQGFEKVTGDLILVQISIYFLTIIQIIIRFLIRDTSCIFVEVFFSPSERMF